MKDNIKVIIKSILYFFIDLGLDPFVLCITEKRKKYGEKFKLIRKQRKYFLSMGGGITHEYPVFEDSSEEAGSTSGHYFHQDLLVASFIYDKKPFDHIDIGSRIDGFVAHVASFRKIKVMDIRKLKDIGQKNINFIQSDLMSAEKCSEFSVDSISCLHAIEHFGLGRYGDPIDPNGHIRGFNNIISMLKPGGTLYISFPIGRTNEVHFNAHRVFHPKDILRWADEPSSISFKRFDYIDDSSTLHQDVGFESEVEVIYGCGIYTIQKN